MGYSEHPDHVRVDFFKPSGKWYTTEEVRWNAAWKAEIQDIRTAFYEVLYHHLRQPDGSFRLNGMIAVCLEPYHEHAHPLMKQVDEAIKALKSGPYGKTYI